MTTAIKPKPQDITIRVITRDGDAERTIRATTYGALAIHRDISVGNTWTITHIPTGRWLCAIWSVVEARKIVRQLLALPVNWNGLTAENVGNLPPDVKKQISMALL